MERVVPLLAGVVVASMFVFGCGEDEANADSDLPDTSREEYDVTDMQDAGRTNDRGTMNSQDSSEPDTSSRAGSDAGDSSDDTSSTDPSNGAFVRHTVDKKAYGPAFAAVADLGDDGSLDLVVSQFGDVGVGVPDGRLAIYRQGADLDTWNRSYVFKESENIKFPNHPTVADLDDDGDLDIVLPYGFFACALFGRPCGGLAWFEQTSGGWNRHDLVESGSSREFYHRAVLVDVDHDGTDDLVTVAEHFNGVSGGATAQWFRGNDSDDRFASKPMEIGEGMGSFVRVLDVDKDSDLDLISAEFFTDSSFAWFERKADPSSADPAGVWKRHVIDDKVGSAIQLSMIPDLYGKGERYAVGANHTNVHEGEPKSAVYAYKVPGNPAKDAWTRTKLSTGVEAAPNQGFAQNLAPGIFGHGDVDRDGDIDLMVSGDGDPDVYWLEQEGGSFKTKVLQKDLTQAGCMNVRDLDGDNNTDVVVSGYDDNVIYIFAWTPGK